MQTVTSADRIMNIGLGFWASKVLLSAVELGLFSALAQQPADVAAIGERVGLHPRSARDFLDGLVSLGFLQRTDGIYRNSEEARRFLDRASEEYVGGLLAMAGRRLFPAWAGLTKTLQTGQPSRSNSEFGGDFQAIYKDPERTQVFLEAMSSLSAKAAADLASGFAWDRCKTFVDVGSAQGRVPVALVNAFPHLRGIGLDLPPARPIFEDFVSRRGLADRITFQAADFFADPLPSADVIIMGHILHDWDLERKRVLIAKAHAALPDGGALLVYESVIDDDRRENTFGLLMSLNMRLMTEGGFDFTAQECRGWMHNAGFVRTDVVKLSGPLSLIVASK